MKVSISVKNRFILFFFFFFLISTVLRAKDVESGLHIDSDFCVTNTISEEKDELPLSRLRPSSHQLPPIAPQLQPAPPIVLPIQPVSSIAPRPQIGGTFVPVVTPSVQVVAPASEVSMVAKPASFEPETEWCLMFYIQASNNLSRFAKYNIEAMAEVGSCKSFHIIVQWHQPRQPGIWRYKVEKGSVDLKYSDGNADTSDCAKNLIDFVSWSVKNFAAKKYALILWNHGVGILDPVWGNPIPVYVNGDYNPRVDVEGITSLETNKEELNDGKPLFEGKFQSAHRLLSCDTKTPLLDEYSHEQLNDVIRGILFDEYNHTYLNNERMVFALRVIKEKVLGGKKLDVLGIDACLMAMAEVMLQVRDYVDYFVSSQEVELAQGWHYKEFLERMVHGPTTPQQFLKNVVESYERLYKGKTQLYTQSGLALDKIKQLRDQIDKVSLAFKANLVANGVAFKELVKRARSKCLQFSTPTYIDLHSFYTECVTQIDQVSTDSKQKFADISSLQYLKTLLQEGMDFITTMVIANTASSNLARARGISIYFPRYFIDQSYPKTEFAHENQWLEFLALNLER